MVGIVIVSHSKKVSEGIKEIIEQMVGKKIKIACVGGEGGVLGVNVEEIVKAIEEVYDDDGVIIFVDFGSTVIGAKTALSLLSEDKRSKVFIANAPILEGAFVAAVEASLGKDIKSVLKAAEEARSIVKLSGS